MTALEWLEATGVARTVGGSLTLTASLSAAHLLGFTLLSGAGFALNLRLVGATLRNTALIDVSRPARVLIAIGLAVSIATGLPLFAARATSVGPNGIFQMKMALLIVAATWQAIVQRRLEEMAAQSPAAARAIGAIGLALWLALAVTACAFILLE